MGNLNLPQIAAAQAQKHQTSNDADDKLDLALTAQLTVDMTSADATLTATQFREAFAFVCSGHGVARILTVAQVSRPFGVVNSGTGAVTVRRGTTNIAVAAGESAVFQTDGTADGLRRLASAGAVTADPYDVGASLVGIPGASAVLMRYPFPRQVIFPAGLTGSRGVCATPATATATFLIKKNGSNVGTMVFATGSPNNVASFTMGSQTTFAAGDILTVVAPASPDATLADIGFGLAGTR